VQEVGVLVRSELSHRDRVGQPESQLTLVELGQLARATRTGQQGVPDPQITGDETDAQRGRERGAGERQAVDSLDRVARGVGEDPQPLDAPAGS
jgi:hypothetical protein